MTRAMERISTQRTPLVRVLAVALLLAVFGLGAASPHAHAGGSHESEVCAGHLSHEGAPNVEHGGSCLLCRSSQRSRSGVTPPAVAVAPVWSERPHVFATFDPLAHAAPGCPRAAPRAPPISASR